MINERQRARYTNSVGSIGFENPDPWGPLYEVRMCIVDTMFHVCVNRNPFPGDDDYVSLRKYIRSCNAHRRDIRLDYIGLAEFIPHERGRPEGTRLEIWYPGHVDLEDMVAIMEAVPEFDAGWLRQALRQRNAEACLPAGDTPHFDGDSNPARLSSGNPGWYLGAWISARGGTLILHRDLPDASLQDLSVNLMRRGAAVELSEPEDARTPFKLRFMWDRPAEGIKATRLAMRQAMQACPGFINCRNPLYGTTLPDGSHRYWTPD